MKKRKEKDMKLMRKFLTTAVQLWQLPLVKYGSIIVIGVAMVGFVGENSLLTLFRNKLYINELNDEISKYNTLTENARRQIKELDHNPRAIERIARERYFMKQDDEDIFVLSDDDRTRKMTIEYDETAE